MFVMLLYIKKKISGIFPVRLFEGIKCMSLFMAGVTFLVISLSTAFKQ